MNVLVMRLLVAEEVLRSSEKSLEGGLAVRHIT